MRRCATTAPQIVCNGGNAGYDPNSPATGDLIILPAVHHFGMTLLASGLAPDEVRDAARKVLEDGGYQTEIPDPVPPELPGWLERFLRWLGSLFSSVDGDSVIEFFMWVVAAVAVFFLVRWLILEFQQRRIRPEKAAEGFSEVPVPGIGPLPDPAALAGAGDFAAAIHALLLTAHQLLAGKLGFDLRAAFTSREILNRVKLDDIAAEELRELVTAVEVSRFGGADVTEPDWDRCRNRYSRFVTAVDEVTG